jgi:nucleoside-diphosphate-sugar epimerase
MSNVLVTGGSGFIASHTILQLLAAGHEVRTTVRHLKRTLDVRTLLQRSGGSSLDRLSFCVADLESDTGWADAAEGCDYVLHVASPVPFGVPKNENDIIVPAREGTLRVLHAASDAKVKRVVLTSSFAAIGYGHAARDTPFTEEDWTNLDASTNTAYVKSKTYAEKAAWEFVATKGESLELAVINPVVVLGPVLGPDYSTSIQLITSMMQGSMPGYPRLRFGVVDVRDVADLHIRAMTHPDAKSQRFLAVAGDFISVIDMAKILKTQMGEAARKVSMRELPDWLVKLAAFVSPVARQAAPEVGKIKNATNAKAKRMLGWTPRSTEEAIVAAATSLIKIGVLSK